MGNYREVIIDFLCLAIFVVIKKKVSQQFRMKKDNLVKLDQKDKLSRTNKASLTPLYLVIFSKISKKVFIKLSFLPD